MQFMAAYEESFKHDSQTTLSSYLMRACPSNNTAVLSYFLPHRHVLQCHCTQTYYDIMYILQQYIRGINFLLRAFRR